MPPPGHIRSRNAAYNWSGGPVHPKYVLYTVSVATSTSIGAGVVGAVLALTAAIASAHTRVGAGC